MVELYNQMSTKEGTNIHKCLESFRYKRCTESWKSLPSVALSIHKIYLLVQSDENNVDFNSRAVCELTVNSSYELDTHLLSVMSLKNLTVNLNEVHIMTLNGMSSKHLRTLMIFEHSTVSLL